MLSTGLPHQFRNTIDFFCRIGPECDACSVGLMILVLGESEELRRFVGASRIKSVEIAAGFRDAVTVRVFREQIQAAAGIGRKTSSLPPCFSLANQCDRNNAFSFSILFSDHQFQPRPGFINCTHFYINKTERQRDGAN